MRGKSATALLSVMTILLVMLTGCGNDFPDMTEEEYDQTVQYAAGLLMRYSNNAVEKLIYVNPDKVVLDDEEETAKTETAKAETTKTETTNTETEIKDADDSTTTTPVAPSIGIKGHKDEASSDGSNIGSSSDKSSSASTNTTKEETDIAETDISVDEASAEKTTEDSSSEAATAPEKTEGSGSSGEKVISYSDEQELMKGLYLRYNGYYVTSSYPENAKTMVIEAGNGKRLLVLSFRVVNESGQDKFLDMVKLNPYFQLTINGNNMGYTSVTMLENDLSTFAGTIAAGESKTLVLVKEIDTSMAKNIQDLQLTISMDGQSQTVIME